MGTGEESLAFGDREVGGNEEHCRGTAGTSLKQLVLVDNEILVKDRQCHTCLSGCTDETIPATEIFLVSQYAYSCRSVLLVGEGYLLSLSILLYPAL